MQPRNFLAGRIKIQGLPLLLQRKGLDMSTDKIAPVHLEPLRACGDNQEENKMFMSPQN